MGASLNLNQVAPLTLVVDLANPALSVAARNAVRLLQEEPTVRHAEGHALHECAMLKGELQIAHENAMLAGNSFSRH